MVPTDFCFAIAAELAAAGLNPYVIDAEDTASFAELNARIAEDARQAEMLAAYATVQNAFAKKSNQVLKQEYAAILTAHGFRAQWVWTASRKEIVRAWAVFAVEPTNTGE